MLMLVSLMTRLLLGFSLRSLEDNAVEIKSRLCHLCFHMNTASRGLSVHSESLTSRLRVVTFWSLGFFFSPFPTSARCKSTQSSHSTNHDSVCHSILLLGPWFLLAMCSRNCDDTRLSSSPAIVYSLCFCHVCTTHVSNTVCVSFTCRKPYGCFEQTSSSTYPMVMVLRYYQSHSSADADPQIVKDATAYLDFVRDTLEIPCSSEANLFRVCECR